MTIAYREDNGRRRILSGFVTEPLDADHLENFFSGDIAYSQAYIADIVEGLEAVSSGRMAEWTAGGNAYSLILRKDTARIECEYDDFHVVTLSLEQFKAIFGVWLEFVNSDRHPQMRRRDNRP